MAHIPGFLAALVLATLGSAAAAQRSPHPLAEAIAAIVDPIVEAERTSTGTPGAAFVFVHRGRIVYSRGYGVADLGSDAPVDPDRTVWPIASITKSVTALAVLQLVEAGRVSLDRDVNDYLVRLHVPDQGFGPLTLRHLLSHTGGLDELPGRRFDAAERPDMAEFLRTRLVRYRRPGQLTAYSTYGIMLAALVVEDVTGQSFEDHVRSRILEPAGMTSARFLTRRGDERGVATPYRLDAGRAEPIAHEYYLSTPASSMVASAADMARLLIVHLSQGRAGGRPLLSPRLMRLVHRQQATIHPALPGWSLGMQMDRVNRRHIVEHGGDIGGFSALLALLPDEEMGFFIVSHGEGSDLRFRVKQALIDGLFPVSDRPAPRPRPGDAARNAAYAGRYLSSLSCRSCPGAAEQTFDIAVAANGTLTLWGQNWVRVRRDLFVREDGQRRLGFARDSSGRILAVSGGSWRVADRLPPSAD